LKPFQRFVKFGIVAAPIVVAALMVLLQPVWLVGLERRYFDVLAPLSGGSSMPSRVTVVEIGQESLRRVGRWPWPRAVLGRLVEAAFEARAAVVVMDMLFSEPDEQDEKLAGGLRRGRAVVGGYFGFRGAPAPCASTIAPIAPAPQNSRLFRASTELCGVPAIARAARVGFLNAAVDADGRLRRLPLLIEFQRQTYPSLALAGAIAALNSHSLRFSALGQPVLEVGGHRVPLDAKGCLWLRPPRQLHRIPAADLLEGKAPGTGLQGQVVVVGGAALGLQDEVVVAGEHLPGVHVQAAALDHLLQGDFVSRPPWAIPLELLVVLAMGSMAALGPRRLHGKWAALSAGAAVLLLGGISAAVATGTGVLLSPVMAQLTVVAVALAVQRNRAGEMRRHGEEVREFMVTALEGLSTLRESTNAAHSGRIQQYMRLLSGACAKQPRIQRALDREAIELMVDLSPIHDLGMAGIPDKVLNREGALSHDELELMKQHVRSGLQILQQARERSGLRDGRLFQVACDLVYSHHERWDGSGYPGKLKGEEIPVAGRILAVADVYDALVSDRPHKPSLPHAQAAAMIVAGRGTLFDPEVVDAFLATAAAWERVGAIE